MCAQSVVDTWARKCAIWQHIWCLISLIYSHLLCLSFSSANHNAVFFLFVYIFCIAAALIHYSPCVANNYSVFISIRSSSQSINDIYDRCRAIQSTKLCFCVNFVPTVKIVEIYIVAWTKIHDHPGNRNSSTSNNN